MASVDPYPHVATESPLGTKTKRLFFILPQAHNSKDKIIHALQIRKPLKIIIPCLFGVWASAPITASGQMIRADWARICLRAAMSGLSIGIIMQATADGRPL